MKRILILAGIIAGLIAVTLWADNEFASTLTLSYTRGFDKWSRTVQPTFAVTNAPRYSAVLVIPTNAVTIVSMPNIVTAGVCFVYNNTATTDVGYVRMSSDGVNWFARVRPNQPAFFRLDSTNLVLITSNTATPHQISIDVFSN